MPDRVLTALLMPLAKLVNFFFCKDLVYAVFVLSEISAVKAKQKQRFTEMEFCC